MFSWTVTLRGPTGGLQDTVTVGHKLYTFGESGKASLNIECQLSVYVLNTGALHWRKLPVRRGEKRLRPEVPLMRSGHSAALVEGIVYIWGGWCRRARDADDRVYAFDVDTHRWLKTHVVSGTLPKVRFKHSACVLGKVMYVHGGSNSNTLQYTSMHKRNDMYKLDTATMVWSSIISGGDLPPASSHHQATIIGTKMFVVGGCGALHITRYTKTPHHHIRVFDTETNRWLSITPSGGGGTSYGAAFAYNGELYVFGRSENFCGLWKFNTNTFSWKKVEPKGKGPSKKPFLDFGCILGDRVFLFDEYDEDLCILDLSPSLQTFCKLAVIQHGLDKSELPHHIKWELAAMMSGGNWQQLGTGCHDVGWELELDGTWKKVTRRKWEMTAGGNWQRQP